MIPNNSDKDLFDEVEMTFHLEDDWEFFRARWNALEKLGAPECCKVFFILFYNELKSPVKSRLEDYKELHIAYAESLPHFKCPSCMSDWLKDFYKGKQK
jgi:hypothetical protein